ncbi:MAG: hypothetical protein II342_03665 [Clostridia bacterium]|nr:hypothetical protein [Clostridia bacterium]MBQ2266481.1 hypothetical protein [Clostridia bacterium]
MEPFLEFLSFIALWLGVMVLIGIALAITQRFRKTDEEKTVSAEEYAKKFEEEMAKPTPEKPIKKFFRNPYVLSNDEIKETKEDTKQ